MPQTVIADAVSFFHRITQEVDKRGIVQLLSDGKEGRLDSKFLKQRQHCRQRLPVDQVLCVEV